MDQNERRVIDELFSKLRQAESQTSPRDPEAEALIREHIARQPGASYYMAQAILVQEHALAALQTRVEELERQSAERPQGGGFLGGLFGGGRPAARSVPPSAQQHAGSLPQSGPWPHMRRGRPGFGGGFGHGGGGFLGGAMQTALGIAGGVLIANALTSAFEPEAAASETVPEEPMAGEDMGGQDMGGEDAFSAGDEASFGDENF